METYGPGFKFEVYDWDKVGKSDRIAKVTIRSFLDLLKMMFEERRLDLAATANVMEYMLVLDKKATLSVLFEITWPTALLPFPAPMRSAFLDQVRSNKIFLVLQKWKINPMFMVTGEEEELDFVF